MINLKWRVLSIFARSHINKILSKLNPFAGLKTLSHNKVCLIFLLFLAACDSFCGVGTMDCGCIDADDFGEYQRTSFQVDTNTSFGSCSYDYSKAIDDESQGGVVLKDCLTTGGITIDYDDQTYTNSDYAYNGDDSPQGCLNFSDDAQIQQLCIAQCISDCTITQLSNMGDTNPEPDWQETSSTFTVTPGHEIYITATGSIVLSGEDTSQSAFISATNHMPHAYQGSNSTTSLDLDVKAGGEKVFEFYGSWTDGSDSGNSGNINVGSQSDDYDQLSDESTLTRIYNGLRRLVAHIKPYPDGYEDGTPFNVDTSLWACQYVSADDLLESNCFSNEYPSASEDEEDIVPEAYEITSSAKGDNLGAIGGMIRWDEDNLDGYSTTPFPDIFCNDATGCIDYTNNPSAGNIIGSISGSHRYDNITGDAVAVSFTSFSSGCSGNDVMSVKHYDSSGNEIYPKRDEMIDIEQYDPNNLGNYYGWSDQESFFYLEPSDYLIMSNPKQNNGVDCAKFYGYRIDPVHDIEIEESGFVSFTMLAEDVSGAGSCTLHLRVVNPNGSRLAYDDFEQDFYEYGNASEDLNSFVLTVNKSNPNINSNQQNWSEAIFLRKGQKLRLSPKSWTGKWNAATGKERQCGIGMAMKIEHRPAFLCRGKVTESFDTNDANCNVIYENDEKVCDKWSPECSQQGDSYCPDSRCQVENPGEVIFDDVDTSCDTFPNSSNAQCQQCYAKMQENTEIAAQNTYDVDLCYNLEDYQGKVANIPVGDEVDEDGLEIYEGGIIDDTKINDIIDKGAQLLTQFNGSFGDMSNADYQYIEGSNAIYRSSNYFSLSQSGRLKFFLLDGEDFNGTVDESIATSYAANSGMDGTPDMNSYSIKLLGKSEFFNGEMLEVILCHADSCYNGNHIEDQPYIVKINDDILNNDGSINLVSHYKFDSAGRLLRFDNANSLGSEPSGSTSEPEDDPSTDEDESLITSNYVSPGQDFYLHNHSSADPGIGDIRLAFKIKDIDEKNCIIETGSTICNTNCNGILIENSFYNSTDSQNTDAICPASGQVGSGEDCENQFYCGHTSENNSGYYNISIKTKNPSGSNISKIVDSVVTPVVEIMDGTPDMNGVSGNTGQAERIYTALINDPTFKLISKAVFVLAIAFYGVGYLMGVSEFSQKEIISRVIRIGIIYLFIGSSGGWYWFDKFFVTFFKEGTDYLAFIMATAFDSSPELEAAIANNDFYDKSILFASVDNVFGIFFSDAAQKKIAALLFASIFGWAYLLIIYFGFMLYVYAVANAVLLYLTSQVFISVLFVIGPLFFVFLFFNQTKEMFDKWLGQLIAFSLQQIFLLTTLAFFNMLMYEALKMSLGFKVCWQDIWVIRYPIPITLLSFWTPMPPNYGQVSLVNVGINSAVPSLFTILFIWIVASLMRQFITFMTDLAASIGGGIRASSLGSGIQAMAAGMQKGFINEWKNSGMKKRIDNRIQRADKTLFDSGKIADKARDERKKQNKQDFSNKKHMMDAGDKAAKQYRRNNGAALAKMTKEQQQKTLNDARRNGMIQEARRRDLSDKKISSLLQDKGLKYVGDNAFGAALTAGSQGARQKLLGRAGSLTQSIDKKGAKTSFSHKDKSKAMRSAKDDSQRAGISEAFKNDNLELKKTVAEKAKGTVFHPVDSAKSASKAIAKASKDIPKSALKKTEQLVKNTGKAIRSPVQSLDNVTMGKEYMQARKDMESAGQLPGRRSGFALAATRSSEKRAVKQYMDSVKQETSPGVSTANNSASSVADSMKTEAKILAQSRQEKFDSAKFKKEAEKYLTSKESLAEKRDVLQQHRAYIDFENAQSKNEVRRYQEQESKVLQKPKLQEMAKYQNELKKTRDKNRQGEIQGKIANLQKSDDYQKEHKQFQAIKFNKAKAESRSRRLGEDSQKVTQNLKDLDKQITQAPSIKRDQYSDPFQKYLDDHQKNLKKYQSEEHKGQQVAPISLGDSGNGSKAVIPDFTERNDKKPERKVDSQEGLSNASDEIGAGGTKGTKAADEEGAGYDRVVDDN